MAASTERTVPSVNSFTLPDTLTAVLLANPGACLTGASGLGHTHRAVERHRRRVVSRRPFPRSLYGPPYHVGCHASRSMRWRICRRRLQVKWLSASWRMKDRACRMRRPPVLNSRCCRLVSDQLWMARGNTSRRKSMALLHRRRDSRGLGGLLHQARAANVVGTCSNASFNSVEARS